MSNASTIMVHACLWQQPWMARRSPRATGLDPGWHAGAHRLDLTGAEHAGSSADTGRPRAPDVRDLTHWPRRPRPPSCRAPRR
eukprot:6031977-Prymnesium_polylepis.1